MARLALVTQEARHVIGIRRPRIVGCMARITVRVDKLVVVVRVTRLTLNRQVGTGENKLRHVVVERGQIPSNG